MPQILTANLLRAGDVVYWNKSQGWVSSLNDAEILPDAEADNALKGAAASVEKREVVAPYLFEVRMKDGRAVPVKAREAIRAAGPSVRPDLGKQSN